MKIGIDVRALQEGHRFRGIGVYLTNLLRSLDRVSRGHQFLLFQWPGPSVAQELELGPRFQIRELPQPLRRPLFRRLKNMLSPDLRLAPDDVDVFLQPDSSYGRPEGRVKTVCVFYDVIPLVFREQYFPSLLGAIKVGSGPARFVRMKLEWLIYRWQLRQMTMADAAIAISQCSKADLIKRFPFVEDAKISVIPLANDPKLKPVQHPGRVLKKFDLRQPFLLYVGGIDFRKNVDALMTSYHNLRDQGLQAQLVLVGDSFDPQKNLLEAGRILGRYSELTSRGDIVRVGFVSTEELAALYSAAAALIFPSLYEGFGLTVLEAMACGCPVVAYNNSSIPEVAGNAALLLEDGESVQSGMTKLLTDSTLRRRLRQRGLAQAKKFSWITTARQTVSLLEKVAGV